MFTDSIYIYCASDHQEAKGTALWLTSVGNEYGHILISVLTDQEGAGLDMMVADLMKT